VTHKTNDSNTFLLKKKPKAIKKEIFEIKSIDGINVAGKTSRLENRYITLLWFSQENIFQDKYISIFSK